MGQIIDIPGQGRVEFPDSMTDEQVDRASKKIYLARQMDAGPDLKTRTANVVDAVLPDRLTKGGSAAVGEPITDEQAKATDASVQAMRGLSLPPDTYAGALMDALDEEVKPVADAGRRALKLPFQALGTAGKLVRGAGADVLAAQSEGRMPDLRNSRAALYNAELPSEAGFNPVQRGLADAAGSAPTVAGGMALASVGVPPPVAFGGVMAGQTAAETGDLNQSLMAGVTGMVLPAFGEMGKRVMASMVVRGVKSGMIAADSTVTQKALEAIGSQAGMTTAAELEHAHEIWNLPPEERKAALVRSVVANLGLGLMELPAFAKGVPSETQRALHEEARRTVDEMVAHLESGKVEISRGDAETQRGEEVGTGRSADVADSADGGVREVVPGVAAEEVRGPLPSRESAAVVDEGALPSSGVGEAEVPAVEGEPLAENGRRSATSLPEPGVEATVEQATLPRSIDSSVVPPPADMPVALADIRRYLSSALDIPVRLGVSGPGSPKKVLGVFKSPSETIRLKMLNDIPTLAHEVGHYIHWVLFPGSTPLQASASRTGFSDFGQVFDGELIPLGQRTSRGSYSAQQVRMEGFAEATRLWLTDRAVAYAAAPQFTAHWESQLAAKAPQVWKVLNQGREDIARYIAQPAAAKVRSMIAVGPQDRSVPLMELLHRGYTDWVNELHPLERTLGKLQKLGLPADQARRAADFATNYIGGWRGKVEHSLYRKQIDFEGREVGPSFKDILKGVPAHDLMGLREYLVAKRSLEKSAQGFATGIVRTDAREVVNAGQAKYDKVAVGLRGWQRQNLRLLVDGGILTPEQMTRMEEQNLDYVPFYRVLEGPGGRGGGPAGGRGFVDLPGGLGRFKGSDRTIVDPLESIVKNAFLFRDLAERNRVGLEFVDAVHGTTGGGRVGEQVARKIKPTTVNHEEAVGFLKSLGLTDGRGNVVDANGAPTGQTLPNDLAFKIWRAAKTENGQNGVFKVFRNGREEFFQIDDPELYRALQLSDTSDQKIFNKLAILKPLRTMTRLLRSGATLTPEFIARNPFRDQLAAGVNSKYGFVPFWDGFRGMLSALKRDDLYHSWVKNGGRYADFVSMDRNTMQEALAAAIPDKTMLRQALDLANPLNVVKNLQKLSELMETSTRLGEYGRGIRSGASGLEAANASKEVTLNFARAGVQGKIVNQLMAFFNASVQDWDKLIRQHIANPARTAAKAGLYITVPSVLAWWLGKDDEKIQALPAWRKNNFWNLNLKVFGGPDVVMTLPKPFLLGQFYGSLPQAALDLAYGKDESAVRHWFTGVLSQLPISPDMLMPTMTRPLIENMANRSFFRNAPLESQALQSMPVTDRANAETSQTAREMARLSGLALPLWAQFSPIKFDNLARGWFGGMAKYGTDATDWLLAKASLVNVPPAAEKSWAEMPLLRGFTVGPYAASKDVQTFYSGLQLAEQRIKGFEAMEPNMSGGREQAWFARNREALALYSGGSLEKLRQVSKMLSTVSKASQIIRDNHVLSPAAKAEKLKALAEIRNKLAGAGVKLLWPGDRKAVD